MTSPEDKSLSATEVSGPHTPIRAWVYIGFAIAYALLVCWVEALGQLHKYPGDVAGAIGYFGGSALGAIVIPFAVAAFATRKRKPRNWLSFSVWFFWVAFIMTSGFGLQRT